MNPKIKFSVVLEKWPFTKRIIARLLNTYQSQLQDSTYDVPLTVIVRNRNEAPRLERLLKCLAEQVYTAKVQLIVVDTESSDNSQAVAKQYGAEILPEKQSTFTYPASLNKALAAAKNELVVITVAHSLPMHNYWFRTIGRHFADPKVAGIFGRPITDDNSRWVNRFVGYLWAKYHLKTVIESAEPSSGTLGATNCVIRISLWHKHHFDKAYEAGGEDTAWAAWALQNGYKVIEDPVFSVHHSHGLRFYQMLRQHREYQRIAAGPLPKSQISPYIVKRYTEQKTEK